MASISGQLADDRPGASDRDITVTAASAREAGSAGTTLSDSTLVDQNVRSFEDLFGQVPNLTATPGGVMGIGQPVIRGIQSPTGAASVIIYLDDAPVQVRPSGFAATSDLQLIDLDRVSVARGPQGTRGGMSALAGSVRFVSRAPDAERATANALAEASATRFGGSSQRVVVSGGTPIMDGRLAMRGAIMARRTGGYVDRLDATSGLIADRDVNSSRDVAGRLSIKGWLGDGWSVTPSLYLHDLRNDDLPLTEQDRGPLSQAFVTRQPGRDRLAIASLSVVRVADDMIFSSITSLLDRDQRQRTDYSRTFGELVLGGAFPGIVTPGGASSLIATRQHNWTHELRFASTPGDRRIDWVAGMFLSRAVTDIDQLVSEPGIELLAQRKLNSSVQALFGVPLLAGGVSYGALETDVETRIALFGDATWHVVPDVALSVGIRATQSRVAIRVAAAGPYAGSDSLDPDRGVQTDRVLTPRAGAVWQASPHTQFRADVARGYRPGGANTPVPPSLCASDLATLGRATAPAGYRSDTLWSYQAGLTHQAKSIRIDHDMFVADWHGIAQQIDLPRCGFGFIANAGRARSRGFETALTVEPLRRVALSGAIGYTDARFSRTATDDILLGVRAGDRLPNVPRWTALLSVQADRPAQSGMLRFRADYSFTSGYFRAASRSAVGYSPATYRGAAVHRLDLLARRDWRRWSATAFVENAIDARPALFRNIDLVPATQSPVREMTLRPRTIGIRTELRL